MLKVEYTTKFKRDLKLAKKRNKNLGALREIMKKIDWLLIYKLIPKEKVVIFVRTGTHADLFN